MNRSIQNVQLHDALRAWIQAILPLLKAPARLHRLSRSQSYLFGELMLSSNGPALRMKEARELFDIIAGIPEFQGHAPTGFAADPDYIHENILAQLIVADFVHHYLLEVADTEFDSKTFAFHYSDLEDYLYRFDDIPIRTTIELWNVRLQSEVLRISLAPGIAIRRLTQEEQSQPRDLSLASLRFGRDVHDWTHKLLIEIERHGRDFPYESEFKRSVISSWSRSNAVEAGERVLTGLRLIRDGEIWLGLTRIFVGNRFVETCSGLDLAERPVWMEQRVTCPR